MSADDAACTACRAGRVDLDEHGRCTECAEIYADAVAGGFLTPDDLSAISKLQVEDTLTTPLETRWDLMLITPGQPALARDLLADLPECDPVPLPTAEDALAALARFEADRPRLLVPPADQDRGVSVAGGRCGQVVGVTDTAEPQRWCDAGVWWSLLTVHERSLPVGGAHAEGQDQDRAGQEG